MLGFASNCFFITRCDRITKEHRWVTGLLLAGSDNPLMPWSNLAGVVLFLTATLFMARVSRWILPLIRLKAQIYLPREGLMP